jgi:hypothetical protein
MTPQATVPTAGVGRIADSPEDGQLYCMAPEDTLPIGGNVSNASKVWVLINSTGHCDPGFSQNPYEAGATDLGAADGAWSGGTISGSATGSYCVVVWWILDGSSTIERQLISFDIAAVGGPSCYEAAAPATATQAFSLQAPTLKQKTKLPSGAVPRRLRVTFQATDFNLPEPLGSLLGGGALQAPPLVLEYCPREANERKGVWTCAAATHGQFWRLEAVRNPAGRWRTTLTMQRVGQAAVLPPFVWSRGDFCLQKGGKLRSQSTPPLPAVLVEGAR